MSGTIVVGVDGNEPAERAAEQAARLAAALDATLHVVCAFNRDQTAHLDAEGTPVDISVADESAVIAQDSAQRLSNIAPNVTSAAVLGRPAEALISEAERLDASLIVVGNARVQTIARVLGSVASAVAHHAPCDVYIAHTN
jgi:nucleotide-binding universal stress UspA family protein